MTDHSSRSPDTPHGEESTDQTAQLRIARLEGAVQVLEQQLAALQAADEHRRAELEAAQTESADARAGQREAQARLEDCKRQVAETRSRLESTEQGRVQAEKERAAIIAVLGRKAKRQLRTGPEPAP